jgi:ketosteroid isomerase-like protein
MRQTFLLFSFLILSLSVFSQANEALKKELDQLNQSIDQAVVNKDIAMLKKHYSEDFIFTHFTGVVDNKESWIKNIEAMGEARFTMRQHDSTTVELHGETAIIFGKLSVVRESKEKKLSNYALWYVRVFVLRNKVWQIVSHRSTKEVK